MSWRAKIARWSTDNLHALAGAEPRMPETLNDRAADAWEPLVAIADLAGGDWPERARAAAIEVSDNAQEASRDDDVDILLLADIRDAFAVFEARVSSDALTDRLVGLEGRPWAEWKNGKPLTKNQLSRRLREKYRIASEALDFGGAEGRKRGYRFAHFADAFERYLPQDGNSTRELVQTYENIGENAAIELVTGTRDHEFEKGQNTSKINVFHEFTSLSPAVSGEGARPASRQSGRHGDGGAPSEADLARTSWSGRIVL
jgi:hypothetical protein